uniref:BZIP domain-containing protein n=1 Tax=Mycena chlorophos TaxID=658473 RepID=A0ABQ0M4A4_MYCCL|nr:predicted protein [Mycena chlorophos]
MSTAFENSASASTLFVSSSSVKIAESVDRVAPNTASPLLSPPAGHNAAFGAQVSDIALLNIDFGSLGGLVASPSIYENLSGMADDDAALSSDFTSFTSGLVASPSIYECLSSLGDDEPYIAGVDVFVSGLVPSPSVYADLSSLGDEDVVSRSALTTSPSFVSDLVSSPPTYENLSSLGDDATSTGVLISGLVSSPSTYDNLSTLGNAVDSADNTTEVSTNDAPSVPTSKIAHVQEASRSCSSTSDDDKLDADTPAFAPVPREKRVRTRVASMRQRECSASTKAASARGRQSSALRISVLLKNAFRVKAETKMRSISIAKREERRRVRKERAEKELVVVREAEERTRASWCVEQARTMTQAEESRATVTDQRAGGYESVREQLSATMEGPEMEIEFEMI